MSRLTLEEVIEAHPTLGEAGFGVGTSEGLLETRGQFDAVCDLLANVEPTKTINRKHASYGLKHVFELLTPERYLGEGTFIAAAIASGFTCERGQRNSCQFNMAEKSIEAIREHLWATRDNPPIAPPRCFYYAKSWAKRKANYSGKLAGEQPPVWESATAAA
ncbi:hypothetical protein [Lacipirellula sp.]|uniref:hypothetical protein n=1 Tax=Lacipirellula sp. TaxID=2691419 RepID=UPI003D0FB924